MEKKTVNQETANNQENRTAQATGKNAERLTEQQNKRTQLSMLCRDLEMAAKLTGEEEKPNELLRKYYRKQGHEELNTFEQWKKKGYKVMKGAKALLMWSKPIMRDKDGKVKAEGEAVKGDDMPEFYAYICLFSNLQVEPIQ